MKIIGLTGGIGSGKSTVSRFLEELGATVIDVDSVWHKALEADAGVRQQLVAAFGSGILASSGGVDRQKLGDVVFGNQEALDRLNSISRPWIYQKVKAQLGQYRRRGVKLVVLELPLLVDVPLSLKAGEPSLSDEVDEVWVTVAPEATVLSRLKERSGITEEQIRARIRSQISAEERARRADVIIDTDCSLEELGARVRELWRERALDTRL
jgi:dephospho-CoA kinase